MGNDTFFYRGRTISDDRGRAVRLVGPSARRDEMSRSLRLKLSYATLRLSRWAACLVLANVMVLVVFQLIGGKYASWQYAMIRVAATSVGLVAGVLLLAAVRSRCERRSITQLRGLSRCASCGYALRGLTPAEDGCVVCPECAAAWRLPA